jgi:hypothetical protein
VERARDGIAKMGEGRWCRPVQPRADVRPHMPAAVKALADRIGVLLERELHDADREVLRCAFLTLAHHVANEEARPCIGWAV